MSIFHPLEVVGRGSETQLHVAEKLNNLIQRLKGWYRLHYFRNTRKNDLKRFDTV